MNFLQKIEEVKERLASWQKNWGNEFYYIISGSHIENEATGEIKEIMHIEEEREIIHYLASKGFLEITKETVNTQEIYIKFLPQPKPIFRLKTLELIARELKDYYTGMAIIDLLKETGVDQRLIIYPQSKWLIFYSVFKELAISTNKDDRYLLAKIICDAIHPLSLAGNAELSEELIKKFNSYLKYDSVFIDEIDSEYMIFSNEEKYDTYANAPEIKKQKENERELEIQQIKQNKVIIKKLRDVHQAYMDVVDIFCQNTKKPTRELNDAYLFLSKQIIEIINQLNLKFHQISFYKPFKNDLYTAEIEWKRDEWTIGPKLSWDAIRPSLHKAHSDIITIQNISEEDAKMTNEEKKFEEITNLISQNRTKKNITKKNQKILKIEIDKMPDLNVKNIDDNIISKNKKKISLPKFPPTDWSKVEIRFINENTVHITANNKTTTADYESLGFRNDKNGKPNTSWRFLFELAKNNGETPEIKSPIKDNIKQQKRILSDRLKTIFKNDTDPFYNFSDTNTYKIKLKLLPPINEEQPDDLGISEHLNKTMTSEYEQD